MSPKLLLSRALRSVYLIPVLFFLLNWPIWLGTHSFSHDAGDGLAAFKFWELAPRYWNWLESAGQPFWLDMGFFRLQDPLTWPLLIPLKLSPLNPLTAFGIFVLIRLCAVGLGAALLAQALGFDWKARQLAAFLTLFGSIGASAYEQLGTIDIALPFLFLGWLAIRFTQTRRGKFLAGAGLVVLHGAFSYHLVLLLPVFLVLGLGILLFYRAALVAFLGALREHWKGALWMTVGIALAFSSVYSATKQRDFLPVLRNMTYNGFVDENGTNLSHNMYKGTNLLNADRMEIGNAGCNQTMHCSQYSLTYLTTFLSPRPIFPEPPWAEYFGFIGRLALVVVLAGLVLGRSKLTTILGTAMGLTFILSLGTKTPFWGLLQSLLPPMMFVRHTHFYLTIWVLMALGLFCIGLERLGARLCASKSGHLIFGLVTAVIIIEGLYFHFTIGRMLKQPVSGQQLRLVASPLPTQLETRVFRFPKSFPTPRSTLATAYGYPAALESLKESFIRNSGAEAVDFVDIRLMGYPTPFILKHTLSSRLLLSPNGEAFKRAFGVFPHGVVSVYPWESAFFDARNQNVTLDALAAGKILLPQDAAATRPVDVTRGEGPTAKVPLKIAGEELEATVEVPRPMLAYFSVPFSVIRSVYIDGRETRFYRANLFGVAVPLSAGTHRVLLRPDLSTKTRATTLYYAAALMLFLYLYRELRSKQPAPVKKSRREGWGQLGEPVRA